MRKKIVISLLAILLLVVTAITSTYALFLNGLDAYLNNIEMRAMTDDYTSISIDGFNFKKRLDLKDIKKAIVASNKGYSFNEDSDFLIDGRVIRATDKLINKEFENIVLAPLTTKNGKDFYELAINETEKLVSLDSGRYASFDLYFKSKVNKPISVYFNTREMNSDYNYQELGFKGKDIDLGNKKNILVSDFNTFDNNGNVIVNSKNDTNIKINASNALRFSTIADEKIKIYEPNLGLGSYATNLCSDNYDSYKAYVSKYDCMKNAQYTYNLSSGANYKPLDYLDMPTIYDSFETIDSLEIINLNHKNEIKKVNFNFWLEGYDADCFSPITSSQISITLSFRGQDAVDSYEIIYHDGNDIKSVKYLSSALLTKITPYIPLTNEKKFVGWYNDNKFESLFDFNTQIKKNEVINLYAKWQD